MKRSNILLLGALIAIFISILSLIIFFRISSDRFIQFENIGNLSVEPTGVIETRNLDYDNFDSLYFESVWDVVVLEGEKSQIKISADSAFFDELKIDQRGKTLHFSDKRFSNGGSGREYNYQVEITMPILELIEFTGMGNVLIKDFNLDDIHIINSGASNIEAENVSIEKLNLIIAGAASVKFSHINIQNCYLDINGAADVELNMTGGELTGQVNGAASVVYSGTVSSETVQVSGIGSLEFSRGTL